MSEESYFPALPHYYILCQLCNLIKMAPNRLCNIRQPRLSWREPHKWHTVCTRSIVGTLDLVSLSCLKRTTRFCFPVGWLVLTTIAIYNLHRVRRFVAFFRVSRPTRVIPAPWTSTRAEWLAILTRSPHQRLIFNEWWCRYFSSKNIKSHFSLITSYSNCSPWLLVTVLKIIVYIVRTWNWISTQRKQFYPV